MVNPTSSVSEHRIPVIVGVGEIVDRPQEITAGLEPLTLLVAALKRAEHDSGGKLLGEIASLDIVNFLSWRYQDPAQQLSERLGIQPAHACYGPVGGESPIRYLHEAAQRIARGECSVAAICGAEAQSTATKAERAGLTLPWTPFAHDVPEPKRGAAFQKPMAVKLGVFRPITVYPFYEAASSAHWARPRARRWRNPAPCGRPIPASPRKIQMPGCSGTSHLRRSRRRRRTTG
jgi:acetyl-CoA C-acetyltransferase